MKPIDLPIYHLPEGGLHMEEMGIDIPIDQCETMVITFFHINAIGPSGYRKSCTVYSNGRSFVCAMTLIALKNKIYSNNSWD